MGVWKGIVWAVGRNTEWGRKQLGRETLLEQGVRERRIELLGRYASNAYHASQAQQGRDLQHKDDEVEVRVKNDWNRDHHRYVTDILVIPRDGTGDRYHVIIDGDGNELLNEYHPRG